MDIKHETIIVKAVNALDEPKQIEVDLSAWNLAGQGKAFAIFGNLSAENSFETPNGIYPVESAVKADSSLVNAELPQHSLTVFILPIK